MMFAAAAAAILVTMTLALIRAIKGPTMSIRRFGARPLEVEDLTGNGSLLPEMVLRVNQKSAPWLHPCSR